MGAEVGARQLLQEVWDEYRADPAFDILRSWKDPELGPLNFVPGEGSVRPVCTFIGEAPGADEDRMGRPFVGASGQFIRSLMESELGLIPEGDCWITNVVKYRPKNNTNPTIRDQMNSWPYLRRELGALVPRSKVVVPLGAIAAAVFDPIMSISSMEGTLRMGKNGWLWVPMFHPAYILRHRGKMTDRYKRGFEVIKMAIETPEANWNEE